MWNNKADTSSHQGRKVTKKNPSDKAYNQLKEKAWLTVETNTSSQLVSIKKMYKKANTSCRHPTETGTSYVIHVLCGKAFIRGKSKGYPTFYITEYN
jgi:hypothetical protein